jgi:hypothetical protein
VKLRTSAQFSAAFDERHGRRDAAFSVPAEAQLEETTRIVLEVFDDEHRFGERFAGEVEQRFVREQIGVFLRPELRAHGGPGLAVACFEWAYLHRRPKDLKLSTRSRPMTR